MIRAWLVGSDAVIANFDAFPGNLRDELETCIKKLTMDLTKKVKQEKLSGQSLNRKTGRLSRSVTPSFDSNGGKFVGIVGTNVSYGRFWELGFDRKVGAGARGGPRKMLENAKARYFQKHPPGVKHYGPRSFLGSALNEMAPEIQAKIEQAVRDSAKKAFGI